MSSTSPPPKKVARAETKSDNSVGDNDAELLYSDSDSDTDNDNDNDGTVNKTNGRAPAQVASADVMARRQIVTVRRRLLPKLATEPPVVVAGVKVVDDLKAASDVVNATSSVEAASAPAPTSAPANDAGDGKVRLTNDPNNNVSDVKAVKDVSIEDGVDNKHVESPNQRKQADREYTTLTGKLYRKMKKDPLFTLVITMVCFAIYLFITRGPIKVQISASNNDQPETRCNVNNKVCIHAPSKAWFTEQHAQFLSNPNLALNSVMVHFYIEDGYQYPHFAYPRTGVTLKYAQYPLAGIKWYENDWHEMDKYNDYIRQVTHIVAGMNAVYQQSACTQNSLQLIQSIEFSISSKIENTIELDQMAQKISKILLQIKFELPPKYDIHVGIVGEPPAWIRIMWNHLLNGRQNKTVLLISPNSTVQDVMDQYNYAMANRNWTWIILVDLPIAVIILALLNGNITLRDVFGFIGSLVFVQVPYNFIRWLGSQLTK